MRKLLGFIDRGGFWSLGFLCATMAGLTYALKPGGVLVPIAGGVALFAFIVDFVAAFVPVGDEES